MYQNQAMAGLLAVVFCCSRQPAARSRADREHFAAAPAFTAYAGAVFVPSLRAVCMKPMNLTSAPIRGANLVPPRMLPPGGCARRQRGSARTVSHRVR
jgi:hypothetical protein